MITIITTIKIIKKIKITISKKSASMGPLSSYISIKDDIIIELFIVLLMVFVWLILMKLNKHPNLGLPKSGNKYNSVNQNLHSLFLEERCVVYFRLYSFPPCPVILWCRVAQLLAARQLGCEKALQVVRAWYDVFLKFLFSDVVPETPQGKLGALCLCFLLLLCSLKIKT